MQECETKVGGNPRLKYFDQQQILVVELEGGIKCPCFLKQRKKVG